MVIELLMEELKLVVVKKEFENVDVFIDNNFRNFGQSRTARTNARLAARNSQNIQKSFHHLLKKPGC